MRRLLFALALFFSIGLSYYANLMNFYTAAIIIWAGSNLARIMFRD